MMSLVDLQIALSRAGDEARISCAGPVDLAARGVLTGHVFEALEGGGTNAVVFDLSAVDLMDSAGLQDLVESVLMCEKRHVAWTLIPSPPVDRLLKLVGLGRLRSDQSGGWLSGGGYGDD
ncbi:MAG: hypothetical protein QOJ13_3402 [Gaiellales bacterium]|nr:hypothetical protein [Gaiellales bacterium]